MYAWSIAKILTAQQNYLNIYIITNNIKSSENITSYYFM